ARFDTSRTYRKRLSMPSGNPSIALFLLEALGHRCDGLQRRFRLQLPGDDRGLEAFGRLGQIIIDDHVVVEILAGVDLVDGLPQPGVDLVVGVQSAVAKALFQRVQRRRKDEYVQRSLLQFLVAVDLPRALIVDVEDHVLAAIEAIDDLPARGPVPVTMNVSPFEKFPSRRHGVELLGLDVVVVDAVALAVARRTRGVRDREVQGDAEGLDLVAHAIDEGRFARARRTGNDEQRAVGVEVTRHSGPARGCARPRSSILRRGSGWPRSATSSPWC